MKHGEFVKKWNLNELLFLQQNSEVLSWKEIGEKLGRTKNSVQAKAIELGVRKTKEFISKRAAVSQFKPGHISVRRERAYANAWTDEQWQYLKDNYETKTCVEIAEHLGRTPGAVKTAAGKILKLTKSKEAKRLIAKRPNKGQFAKGGVPVNTLHDQAIKIRTSNGRLAKWIRISLGNWEQLHRYNWKAAGHEIPAGHVLQFIDGDPMNCEVSNLKLVRRGPHSRGQDYSARKIMSAAVIEQRAKKREEKLRLIEEARGLKLQARQSRTEANETAKILRRARKLQKTITILQARQEADQARQIKLAEIEQAKAARKLVLEARALKQERKILRGNRKEEQKRERESTRLQKSQVKMLKTVRIEERSSNRAVAKPSTSTAKALARSERQRVRALELRSKENVKKRDNARKKEELRIHKANKEKRRLEQERSERQRLPTRVIDTSTLIPLRIDAKTIIYIKPGVDPEAVKQRFLNRNFNNNQIEL